MPKTFKKTGRQDHLGRDLFEIEETTTTTKTDKAIITIEELEKEIGVYEALLAKKKIELSELKKL